jgi:Mce-associated membrane protein
LSRRKEGHSSTAAPERVLADLPLRPAEVADLSSPLDGHTPARDPAPADAPTAGLARRAGAFAADIATVLLVWAVAVLAALVLRAEVPREAGLLWSGGFALLLFFFATVPALILFGKTVGMAVAGLAARPLEDRRRLTAREAARRWLGTMVTVVTLGTALLVTMWSAESPTPADRLSGRPLVEEEPGVDG